MTRAACISAAASAMVIGLTIGSVMTGTTRPAEAHAILVESHPALGGAVPAGALDIDLRYNSRIDRARSRISLTRPDHTSAVLQIAPSSPEDSLDTTIDLAAGPYVLHWQVLATDGHITRGDVPFTVGKP